MNTLLSTKLYIPPLRRDLVPRPRLIERLDTGLQGKLTVVSAPAGYGKTTLVSNWVHQQEAGGKRQEESGGSALHPASRILHPSRVAWLSLDAADNDPIRFFSYTIAALQGIHPDIGSDIQPILESEADPPIEHLLTALVNDVAVLAGNLVLVLDDYHVIHEIKIHQALDFLFDYIPPEMHVLIISRADPPMPLGRLRVQRELVEIREADLRFTLDEATAFLNGLMGLALSEQDVVDLKARTEGWIAGLQLAAMTLQGRPDRQDQVAAITGSHRHLIEYLVHEVGSRAGIIFQQYHSIRAIADCFNPTKSRLPITLLHPPFSPIKDHPFSILLEW